MADCPKLTSHSWKEAPRLDSPGSRAHCATRLGSGSGSFHPPASTTATARLILTRIRNDGSACRSRLPTSQSQSTMILWGTFQFQTGPYFGFPEATPLLDNGALCVGAGGEPSTGARWSRALFFGGGLGGQVGGRERGKRAREGADCESHILVRGTRLPRLGLGLPGSHAHYVTLLGSGSGSLHPPASM